MENISIFWLLTILVGLIFLSAFFSSAETSMMAINRYRLKTLAKTNNNAKLVVNLLDKIDELIGTILLGNNLVNIFAASIVTIIALRVWGDSGVVIASLLLTLVILIFAETAPKIFAAKYPEKIALPAGFVISKLVFIFKPVVYIINIFAQFYLKLLGVSKNEAKKGINSEELTMAVYDAKYKISNHYQTMLLNILSLEKATVEDIMIPKSELIGVNINDSSDIIAQLQRTQHTRLLVFDELEENIIGLLHIRNVVNLYAQGEFTTDNLKKLIRTPYFVPENTTLSSQLKAFQKNNRRLGLVVDEYGSVRGMVVLEDILEEIVGHFTSNQSESFGEIIRQEDGSYLVNPRINIRELNQILSLSLPSDQTKTLNGLLIEYLQDIPKRHMSVKMNNILFEIIQVDSSGIKLVKVIMPEYHCKN